MHGFRFPSFLLLGATSFLLGCGPNYVFEESHRFEEGSWTYADSVSFHTRIDDTMAVYNLYVVVDHGVDFPFQNLYLNIHTNFPDGNRLTEMVSLEFATKSGMWHGDCNSEDCDLRITLQENAFFEQAGDYTFTFEQFTRRDPLPGLNALSFALEKTAQRQAAQ